MSGSCFTISSCLSSSSHTSVRSRQLSDYKIHCSWLQQSKLIIYLLWSKFCETHATFRSASTDLDHESVVACGLTQISAEGSGCRWGAVGIPDHDSWRGHVVWCEWSPWLYVWATPALNSSSQWPRVEADRNVTNVSQNSLKSKSIYYQLWDYTTVQRRQQWCSSRVLFPYTMFHERLSLVLVRYLIPTIFIVTWIWFDARYSILLS